MSIRKFIEYKYKEKQIISRLLPVHFFYNSRNFDDLSLQNKNGNGIQAEERRERRRIENEIETRLSPHSKAIRAD